MTALTDYSKNLLARALVGRQPSLPVAVWVALGTGGTDASGLTGEPAAATGYMRQPVAFTGSGSQRNAAATRFAFTSGVGTLTHVGLFDAVSGGNALAWGALGTPATLNAAGTITVPAESLTVLAD
ncbi:hypothetical protein GXW74_23395 [Roseomonas eburnea]|uniref:Uncharacterized protein n=1 Tax=Neoroseomonas eburnea TaxID=1346889 RepID=A0A9X9XIB5_9PROT|nr:hypothetical protein [Neoroseomonas eburnea]MBR0683451.1 hypothetical protein [Neoroseomonas eburnea]